MAIYTYVIALICLSMIVLYTTFLHFQDVETFHGKNIRQPHNEEIKSLAKLVGSKREELLKNLVNLKNRNVSLSNQESLQEQYNQNERPGIIPPEIILTTSNHDNGDNANSILAQHKKHKILALSDQEFDNTPLNEMMAWYGEAEGGGSCSDDFGNKLVNRWRDKKETFCSSDINSKYPSSAVECYPVKQTRHNGFCDNICEMKDISIDIGIFDNEKLSTNTIREYVQTRHNKLPYMKYPKGEENPISIAYC